MEIGAGLPVFIGQTGGRRGLMGFWSPLLQNPRPVMVNRMSFGGRSSPAKITLWVCPVPVVSRGSIKKTT